MVVAVCPIRVLDNKVTYFTEKPSVLGRGGQFSFVHSVEGAGAAAVVSTVVHESSIGN
jgi:hypothetical protein